MKTLHPVSGYNPKNECLKCFRYIGGKCAWQKGDYCRILRSR